MRSLAKTFYTTLLKKTTTDRKVSQDLIAIASPKLTICGNNQANNLVGRKLEGEVLRALKEAPKGKTAGPDSIPVDVYRALKNEISDDLQELFNFCLEEDG
ncbi:hypothetical protein DSO57_1010887 [Entomophthora muscae]|uniref:Uncharacterized protein n=1 Tax=Entomophthora muscae TaxID=34485 RepID=A0ACC2SJ75_9FUNG|nr:hypothetical protein DSO57_1010887 [Entomophthora muscae]